MVSEAHKRGPCRYEEAFGRALNRGDLGTVAWLCKQADPVAVLAGGGGPALSQGVLLSLVQQLGSDLTQARRPWHPDRDPGGCSSDGLASRRVSLCLAGRPFAGHE